MKRTLQDFLLGGIDKIRRDRRATRDLATGSTVGE